MRKESPRVPLLDDFKTYATYGKNLAALNLNYEYLDNDFVKVDINEKVNNDKKLYRVEKMRFGKSGDKSVKKLVSWTLGVQFQHRKSELTPFRNISKRRTLSFRIELLMG